MRSPLLGGIGGLITNNAIFAALLELIGLALAALTAGATAARLIGLAWRPVGLACGLALAIGTATGPMLLDGSRVLAVALIGFPVWCAFVVRSSVALLRAPAHVA